MEMAQSTGQQSAQLQQSLSEQRIIKSTRLFPCTALPKQQGSVAISVLSNSRLLCDGLLTLLAEQIDLRHVETPASLQATHRSSAELCEHIVLLDSNLGIETVLNWINIWRSRQPPARVIVLELNDDDEVIFACVAAGASGFTFRGDTVSDLVETISFVWRGLARCSPQMTARLFERLEKSESYLDQSITYSAVSLTPRELEVLHYVAEGYSNSQIADTLVIAISTVKNHVHNILDKLQLDRRTEAAELAREQGWLQNSENTL